MSDYKHNGLYVYDAMSQTFNEAVVTNIDGTDFNECLDSGEFPESVASKIEAALERMQAAPGGSSETITIVIANDFEAEDEESEDEDEESA